MSKEKAKPKGIALNFNQCACILFMFPPQWQGSEKELEVLGEFIEEMEAAAQAVEAKIAEVKKSFTAQLIDEKEFKSQSTKLGETECYVLASSKALNMIKSEWPTRKWPRVYAKHVLSLRDKIGLF